MVRDFCVIFMPIDEIPLQMMPRVLGVPRRRVVRLVDMEAATKTQTGITLRWQIRADIHSICVATFIARHLFPFFEDHASFCMALPHIGVQ